MGTSQKTSMHFDLVSLFGQRQNSDIFYKLELPFTEEEIDVVVKNFPTDQSPGPDGFNNEFLKSCWDIIKEMCSNSYMIFIQGKFLLRA